MVGATTTDGDTRLLDASTGTTGTGTTGTGTRRAAGLRVAINLLTEDPAKPSGADLCWWRVIPEMAKRLQSDEQLHLLVSPKLRPNYQGYGPNVRYITFPWSNERRSLRTLSEHVYSPARLPLSKIDIFATLMAPLVSPTWSVVIHMRTMHAYSEPGSVKGAVRLYRRMSYPRSARVAEAIVVNSEALRSEVQKYLDVDPSKFRLIYEAVDHDLFKPDSPAEARRNLARYGVNKPFALFVSSLWPYKNCDGLLRAWALKRGQMGGRQLVIVGLARYEKYGADLRAMATDLGIADDVVWVGGVAHEQVPSFYRAADVLVYPSFNETFGLPILEAMACGCPVVTSNQSSMPEVAGGAAVLCDPHEPASIATAIVDATGSGAASLRDRGFRRAGEFTWGAVASATLDVYREVAERRRQRGK
jgi:glycosyltransferase involved in cell wall biosynthesis